MQLTAGLCTVAVDAGEAAPADKRRIRFGVSTYSYWHFKGDKNPIEAVIEEAGRLGFDGV